ncbi:hypothetical protein SAMN05920897_10544 [Alkalispirochaeta americana]|uniref:Uncharacterized protein n=1 Tax=Alkalispirochaeta americana TaxID=159291 RepID=A0A1N6QTW4_9SPIO|nr:hypothetical protein [Alkalispirochaeta americana]SIQ19952.1 hypothetical protein SAMN05920897_10544 [Alkalispirochaeta americana]
MKNTVEALLSGYGTLFQRTLRAISTLIILAAASALTTIPIWLLATRVPRLFNGLVLVVLLAGGISIFRQKRRLRRIEGGADAARTPLVLRGISLLAALFVLGGILRNSLVLALAGVILLSGHLAWSLGSSRGNSRRHHRGN